MALDLETFTPVNAGELLDGILEYIIPIAGSEWKKNKKEVGGYLENVAAAAFATQSRLIRGEIGTREADLLLHAQELALNQVLLYSEFSSYVVAQRILDGVFKVITSAIRNITGIDVFQIAMIGGAD